MENEDMAKKASMAFREGRFEDCAGFLHRLKLLNTTDPIVLHNVAVCGYFKDGCSDHIKLLKELVDVKKQSDELSRAPGEHADSVSYTGSLPVMFNMAVILFSSYNYAEAYSYLKALYQKIEAVDEEAATAKICLLFLDVALATQDPRRCFDVITYMEKAYGVGNSSGQVDHGSSIQGTSNLITKTSSLPSNAAVTDASHSDLVANTNNAVEASALSRTRTEENLETLNSTVDMTGQNSLRLKLQLYKVRYLLLTGNLEAAEQAVKTATHMDLACGRNASVLLLLKSQLEYDRRNYSEAFKLLMDYKKASDPNDMEMLIIYNNNHGCIYYRLGKYHTSSLFFSSAVTITRSLLKEKPLKLSTSSQAKCEILYNTGIMYLARGEPISAARCFEKSVKYRHDRPILWLRFAECCLLAFNKELGETQNGCAVKVRVLGKGNWRHLAIETCGFGDPYFVLGGDKQPKLSLSIARSYLHNALYLLDASIVDYERTLRQAILCDLAFVELKLGNSLVALTRARSLLRLEECSKIYIFFGNVYAAESLCLLNQPTEAAELLVTYLSRDDKFKFPYNEDDCEKWRVVKKMDCEDQNVGSSSPDKLQDEVLNPEEACGTLYVNRAVLFALAGDVEKARQFANEGLSRLPNSSDAIITAIFVDLASGDTQAAVARLKKCGHVRFIPKD